MLAITDLPTPFIVVIVVLLVGIASIGRCFGCRPIIGDVHTQRPPCPSEVRLT